MKKKIFILAYILSVVVVMVLFPAPATADLDLVSCPPFQKISHPLGCDRLGRDNLALFAYGSFFTALLAIPSRFLALATAGILSLFTYKFSTFGEYIVDSLASVFLSIPSQIIGLVLVFFAGGSIPALISALILSEWAYSYQAIRTKISDLSGKGFSISAYLFGAGKFYIFRKHIFPHTIPMIRALFFSGLPGTIMLIAIFSYLGIDFGGNRFGPLLGEQIAYSKDFFDKTPFSVILPSVGIFLLVNSFQEKDG